jgi:hypothetical protein
MRRRPGPQPSGPTHEELFREAFMHALQGCCSQFESPALSGHKPHHSSGDSELERARQLTRRAWNTAAYACQLFEERNTVSAFEEEVE